VKHRIAGVDPGTVRAGVSILDVTDGSMKLTFSGTIHANQKKPIAERLEIIFLELKALFEEWSPDVLALENVFYQKDFKAAIKVGEARAAAIIAARLSKIPVSEYPPARVKQSVCGNGRASKDQVQYMVRHILKLKGPLTADSSDAIALALCHWNTMKFSALTQTNTPMHMRRNMHKKVRTNV
jgi:crossover junction endodeoxyribonuclease RuvC